MQSQLVGRELGLPEIVLQNEDILAKQTFASGQGQDDTQKAQPFHSVHVSATNVGNATNKVSTGLINKKIINKAPAADLDRLCLSNNYSNE